MRLYDYIAMYDNSTILINTFYYFPNIKKYINEIESVLNFIRAVLPSFEPNNNCEVRFFVNKDEEFNIDSFIVYFTKSRNLYFDIINLIDISNIDIKIESKNFVDCAFDNLNIISYLIAFVYEQYSKIEKEMNDNEISNFEEELTKLFKKNDNFEKKFGLSSEFLSKFIIECLEK